MRRTRTSLGGPLDAVDRGAKPPADLPLGISPVVWELSVPASVAPVPERVALGSALFSDERLSLNDTVSSATCHEQFGRVALLHDDQLVHREPGLLVLAIFVWQHLVLFLLKGGVPLVGPCVALWLVVELAGAFRPGEIR